MGDGPRARLWAIISIWLIKVRRPFHCGRHRSLGWELGCIQMYTKWVEYSLSSPSASCLWIWCDQLLQALAARDLLPWWTVYPELWTRIDPLCLKLLLSGCCIKATGKERKARTIFILQKSNYILDNQCVFVLFHFLPLWHEPHIQRESSGLRCGWRKRCSIAGWQLESVWWKERTRSCKLSFDRQSVREHTHTVNK